MAASLFAVFWASVRCHPRHRVHPLLTTLAAAFTLIGFQLQGCGECKPKAMCDMKKLCHSCCDDDPFEPDPVCANHSSVRAPVPEAENKVCHDFCENKCPEMFNGSNPGACVGPSRQAAGSVTEAQFGKVHRDSNTVRFLQLRGQKGNESSGGDATTSCFWRQTGNCNAKGPREPEHDQPCNAVIDAGRSGYCECPNEGKGTTRRGYEQGCKGDFSFTCEIVCGGPKMCLWMQTGGCNPDGPRESDNDKECTFKIEPGWSGYCACGPDRTATRKSDCKGKDSFTCLEACSKLLLASSEVDEDDGSKEL